MTKKRGAILIIALILLIIFSQIIVYADTKGYRIETYLNSETEEREYKCVSILRSDYDKLDKEERAVYAFYETEEECKKSIESKEFLERAKAALSKFEGDGKKWIIIETGNKQECIGLTDQEYLDLYENVIYYETRARCEIEILYKGKFTFLGKVSTTIKDFADWTGGQFWKIFGGSYKGKTFLFGSAGGYFLSGFLVIIWLVLFYWFYETWLDRMNGREEGLFPFLEYGMILKDIIFKRIGLAKFDISVSPYDIKNPGTTGRDKYSSPPAKVLSLFSLWQLPTNYSGRGEGIARILGIGILGGIVYFIAAWFIPFINRLIQIITFDFFIQNNFVIRSLVLSLYIVIIPGVAGMLVKYMRRRRRYNKKLHEELGRAQMRIAGKS